MCYREAGNAWWAAKLVRRCHGSSVTAVAWHPNGCLLASTSTDGRCKVFNAAVAGAVTLLAFCYCLLWKHKMYNVIAWCLAHMVPCTQLIYKQRADSMTKISKVKRCFDVGQLQESTVRPRWRRPRGCLGILSCMWRLATDGALASHGPRQVPHHHHPPAHASRTAVQPCSCMCPVSAPSMKTPC